MRTVLTIAGALMAAGCAARGPLVLVVEEHYEAPAMWAAAGARGATLLHLDSHEDMGEPDEDGELSPADVIVPARRAGTIDRVLWVRPGENMPAPDGPVIVDIDLDFFACENPHAAHEDREISRAEYEAALAAGRVRMKGEAREGSAVTESAVLARPPGPFSWPVRLDRVLDEATGAVHYVRGCICMGEYRDAFPVRRPSDAEVEALVRQVRDALARFPSPPLAITIARSVGSGFTPAARAPAIEALLLSALREIGLAGE
jgi:hypothetical protein